MARHRPARVEVRNAGSERQVRRAERSEREYADWFGEGLITTLGTALGRRTIFGILSEAGIYETVWHDHGARMAFNVGRQDFGHWLYAQCLAVDEDLTQLMEREAREWKRRTDTPRVEDEGDSSDDS